MQRLTKTEKEVVDLLRAGLTLSRVRWSRKWGLFRSFDRKKPIKEVQDRVVSSLVSKQAIHVSKDTGRYAPKEQAQ